ncbi:MAG: hypothetical protein DI587_37695 [Variovorax paradoxus]|nr:MAG: hypothetical protein DI583_37695 [Variovorax paradoxus]PZP99886.1 MAG: hypothetical protein DI587_37695 [Variovorax paradoxus]
MSIDIETGMVAVVVRNSHDENVGLMLRVGEPYDGPGPAESPRQAGWFLVNPFCAVIADMERALPPFALWRAHGRLCVHESDLVPLRDMSGEIVRWRPVEDDDTGKPRAKVFAFPARQAAALDASD